MDEYGGSASKGECVSYYANRVSLNDMHPELAGVKYSELHYNPKTANPWAHVRAGESVTIWIIPK